MSIFKRRPKRLPAVTRAEQFTIEQLKKDYDKDYEEKRCKFTGYFYTTDCESYASGYKPWGTNILRWRRLDATEAGQKLKILMQAAEEYRIRLGQRPRTANNDLWKLWVAAHHAAGLIEPSERCMEEYKRILLSSTRTIQWSLGRGKTLVAGIPSTVEGDNPGTGL